MARLLSHPFPSRLPRSAAQALPPWPLDPLLRTRCAGASRRHAVRPRKETRVRKDSRREILTLLQFSVPLPSRYLSQEECPRHPNRDDRDSKITNVVGFELCMHCSIVVQYFEKRRCLACESIRNRIDSSAIHLALCTLNRFGKCFGSDFWAPRRRHGDHTAAILATDPVEHEDVANSWPSRRMRWPVFMPVLLCVG